MLHISCIIWSLWVLTSNLNKKHTKQGSINASDQNSLRIFFPFFLLSITMYKRCNPNIQNLPISQLEHSLCLRYYWIFFNNVQQFNKNVEGLMWQRIVTLPFQYFSKPVGTWNPPMTFSQISQEEAIYRTWTWLDLCEICYFVRFISVRIMFSRYKDIL